MGCGFCASGESGFERNLTAGEMCAQVYNVQNCRSVVLMGCGEPLDNYGATLRFIELITHPKGINIGQRHITVSTCGLVPQIYELAKLKLQVNLAVSLHAPSDDVRRLLMPVAKAHPLADLIPSCRRYAELTKRRITFEYALIKDMNSSTSYANALAKLLKGLLCHVNLIPINYARENLPPASKEEAAAFLAELEKQRIPATIRRSLGTDINAACGQLRAGIINSSK